MAQIEKDKIRPSLTSKQAADLLGVTMHTIHRWIENGLLEAWKTPGGHRRITQESVDKLLEKRDHELEESRSHGLLTILVVEDDPKMQEAYRLHLGTLGTRVKINIASSGLEGLLQVAKEKPDVIITDLMMPDLNGFQMIHKLKEDSTFKKIQIIVVSVLSQLEMEDRGGIPDDVQFLRKPVKFAELKKTLIDFATGKI
ncbi:MAG: response regulator [Magnetococcus sp. DMHC-6]